MARCGGLGSTHTFTTSDGTSRCFQVYVPSITTPLPVLVMHHGRTGTAGQFCTEGFKATADDRGFALVCTAAIGGNWQFATLEPGGDANSCDADDSADLEYSKPRHSPATSRHPARPRLSACNWRGQ